MPTIVLIGGVTDLPPGHDLASSLGQTAPDVKWEWLRANPPRWNVDQKKFYALLSRVDSQGDITLVQLWTLNKDRKRDLKPRDPVLVPKGLSYENLLAWLVSPEANLVPRTEWTGSKNETAAVAILSKLVKNKDWNKDRSGHQWTKEEDLFNQPPVTRYPAVQRIARKTAARLLNAGVLLDKGGTAGTPKGWSINTEFVPATKKSLLLGTMAPLAEAVPSLSDFLQASEGEFRITGSIVSESVLCICR